MSIFRIRFLSSKRRGGAEHRVGQFGRTFRQSDHPSAPSLRSTRLFLEASPIGLALRALLCEEGNTLVE